MKLQLTLPGVALTLLVFTANLRAQEAPSATFGIEQRVRNENWNNLFDFNGQTNDEREQIRYRTRVWTQLQVGSNVELNLGMNSETNQKLGLDSNVDEIVFDIANINIRKLFVKGLSLKIGRQDLMRGEGFIFLEGTPGDGSRSLYFNAFDLAYSFGKSQIEAIGILDPKQDRFLPRINDQHKCLQDWDEQALGLYYTGKDLSATTIESYYFHKKEIRNRLAPTHPQFQPDRTIETAGGRVVQKIGKRWSATAEMAGQWGVQHPSTPIRAWAGYSYLKRQSDAKGRPYVQAGLWAMSGDDPGQPGRISGWDPLFARSAKWGDLDLYSAASEKGVGYSTNLKRWQVETGFVPAQRLAWKFVYYKLDAFHPFGRNAAVFGTGTDRGNSLQTRLDFKLNGHLRGHVDYETLLAGNYYTHRDPAYFLRFELIAEASGSVKKLTSLFGN